MLITGCNSGTDASSIDTSSYNQADLDYDPLAPVRFHKISSSSMEKYDQQWITLTVYNNTDEEISASNSAGASNSAQIFSKTKNKILPENMNGSKIWEWSGWIVEENSFDAGGLKVAPKQSGVMLIIVNRGIYLNEKLELSIQFKGSQTNNVYPLKQELVVPPTKWVR